MQTNVFLYIAIEVTRVGLDFKSDSNHCGGDIIQDAFDSFNGV